MNISNQRKTNKGFSLIELAIVVAVVAVLIAVAVPKFANADKSAEEALIAGEVSHLQTAAYVYTMRQGTPPNGFNDYVTTQAPPYPSPFTISMADFKSPSNQSPGVTCQIGSPSPAGDSMNCIQLKFYSVYYTYAEGVINVFKIPR
ncbi:MAG: prepilin-type N-terminal cleavage/methylation domain-containing protein [Cyanobacteria bacterium]|nr:prepilin-type N-terminal cleavage/methylation domain-containing protein [Cyanobacteriota bacterium]